MKGTICTVLTTAISRGKVHKPSPVSSRASPTPKPVKKEEGSRREIVLTSCYEVWLWRLLQLLKTRALTQLNPG